MKPFPRSSSKTPPFPIIMCRIFWKLMWILKRWALKTLFWGINRVHDYLSSPLTQFFQAQKPKPHTLYCDFTAHNLEGTVIVFRSILIVYPTHAAKLPLESVKERKPACILIFVCKSTAVSRVTCPRGITQSTVLVNDHRQPSVTLMYPLNVYSKHLI